MLRQRLSYQLVFIVISVLVSSCGPSQGVGSTLTPVSTNIPKATEIPSATATMMPTPTPLTLTPVMIVPKLGKWTTGEIPVSDNGYLKIDFPVGLEDGKYSLYVASYIYNIGGIINGGTWGAITETDIFSTSQDISADTSLTINGRFVSSTEAEGTISYTNLPTVEWTATWQSE
jgi:hypothetical protein